MNVEATACRNALNPTLCDTRSRLINSILADSDPSCNLFISLLPHAFLYPTMTSFSNFTRRFAAFLIKSSILKKLFLARFSCLRLPNRTRVERLASMWLVLCQCLTKLGLSSGFVGFRFWFGLRVDTPKSTSAGGSVVA